MYSVLCLYSVEVTRVIMKPERRANWKKIRNFIAKTNRNMSQDYHNVVEDYKKLVQCWEDQSNVFSERIQRCRETVQDIKETVLNNFKVQVKSNGYTRRGSDNYLVCWSSIKSYSFWSDDEYLKLPSVDIRVSTYDEKSEEKWVNPEYPTFESQQEAASILEIELKKEIAEYFDSEYNKEEHLSYLISKALRDFSAPSTWDHQILWPIIRRYNFEEVANTIINSVSDENQFYAKRMIINLLTEYLKKLITDNSVSNT